jgi:hypothetical protein
MKFVMLMTLLLGLSFGAIAQDNVPDYVKENSIYKELTSSEGQNNPYFMRFDDGFEQMMKPPYKFVKSDLQPRCPCSVYHFSFINEKGETITRDIEISLGDDKGIKYYGADGRTKYNLTQLLDMAKNPVAGNVPSYENCRYIGKPHILTIKNPNASCGDAKVCYGKIADCGEYNDVEVSCVSQGDNCPSAKDCLEDPNVIFSNARGVLPNKSMPNNTRGSGSNSADQK